MLLRKLIIMSLLLVLPVFAAKKKKEEEKEKEEPPVTYDMLMAYGQEVLDAGVKKKAPENLYLEKKFEQIRKRVLYISKSSGACFLLVSKADWTFLIEFTPEKSFKSDSLMTINGVIKEVNIYDKEVQSKKTIYLKLDTSDKKAVKGRSERSKKLSFDDLARIGDDYYSLPGSLRNLLPMPINRDIETFTEEVSSTNKESRAVNFREKAGGWEIQLKIKSTERLKQKALVKVKGAEIDSIKIFRQNARYMGKITIECDATFDVIKSKDDDDKKD